MDDYIKDIVIDVLHNLALKFGINPKSFYIYTFQGVNQIKFIIKSWSTEGDKFLNILGGDVIKADNYEGNLFYFIIDVSNNIFIKTGYNSKIEYIPLLKHSELTFNVKYFEILTLPEEIWVHIGSFLKNDDLIILSDSSDYLLSIFVKNRNVLLKSIIHDKYPHLVINITGIDYVSLNKEIETLIQQDNPEAQNGINPNLPYQPLNYHNGKLLFDNLLFKRAIRSNFINLVEILINSENIDLLDGTNSTNNKSYPLRLAAERGYEEIFDLIYNKLRDYPKDEKYITMFNKTVETSGLSGNINIVKKLVSDPHYIPNQILLTSSAQSGDLELVKYVLSLPGIDPTYNNNNAFLISIRDNEWDIFETFLNDPRIDPSIGQNMAFILAAQEGRIDMVKRLLLDPRVNPSDQNNTAIKIVSRKISEIGFFTQSVYLNILELIRSDMRYVTVTTFMGFNL